MSELEQDKTAGILRAIEEIHRIRDLDMVLEHILQEARQYSHADGGSIYLVEKERLRISYIQNDSLFATDRANPLFYTNTAVAISPDSLAGYVALTKTPLRIDDAYQLPPDVPFQLNRQFDLANRYRTQSLLTIPLMANNERLIGVLQIINAKDASGRSIPFTTSDQITATLFASYAATAIERAQMTREIILRMIKMAELRDPEETGSHVKRVGSYSVEIYSQWAKKKQVPTPEAKRTSDLLKIASMLHDVGKVAISDTLLKKKTHLLPEEFEQMKWHTLFGAQLFSDSTSDWDDMAREIALGHHEKWDGSGYPGAVSDLVHLPAKLSSGRKGEAIPLPARIVALADVYDALASSRSYKDAWPEERIMEFVQEQKGKHFDPEVADAFLAVHDVIHRLKGKYSNPG